MLAYLTNMTNNLCRITGAVALSVLLCAASPAANGQGKGATGGSGAAGSSGTVAYADLAAKPPKVALPYGEPFTITGQLSDVQINGAPLIDVLQVQSVGGNYVTGNSTLTAIATSSVSGTKWQASIGSLTADTAVTFNFQFFGLLPTSLRQTVINKLLVDPAFRTAIAHFKTDESKSATDLAGDMRVLSQATLDVLLSILSQNGLTPKDPEGLKTALAPLIVTNGKALFNLSQRYAQAQNPNADYPLLAGMAPKDFVALSLDQTYTKLKAVTDADYKKVGPKLEVQDADKKLVADFIKDYEQFSGALELLNATLFTSTSSLAFAADQQAALVSDLKKYAGFDVGALYSYRLNELRSFAMVNIYLGPVQLKTDGPPLKPGGWEKVRERVSLSFGMALKDISGGSNSKISAENAFIYGVGVRLNKYFRLTTGGLLYRTTLPGGTGTNGANGALRHEFFIGPSIDVTALPALKSIFAASKSN